MPRPFASPVVLKPDLRESLDALIRARSTPQALVFRCRLILHAAHSDEPTNQQIADHFGCNRHTVGRWRERFVADGNKAAVASVSVAARYGNDYSIHHDPIAGKQGHWLRTSETVI